MPLVMGSQHVLGLGSKQSLVGQNGSKIEFNFKTFKFVCLKCLQNSCIPIIQVSFC